jgi:hypothetical protein
MLLVHTKYVQKCVHTLTAKVKRGVQDITSYAGIRLAFRRAKDRRRMAEA